MFRIIKWLVVSVVLIAVCFWVYKSYFSGKNISASQIYEVVKPKSEKMKEKEITINIDGVEKKYIVEVADNYDSRAQGLMNRQYLEKGKGMLFVFPTEKIQTFWMKNTLIPLDMIFLDKDWKVVDIIKNAQPCKTEKCELFVSKFPAKYVVEVGAGD